MSESYSLYEEAQVLMAGVRLFKHREKRIPSLKELAGFLDFSVESVYHLCNRLEKIGAVEKIRGAFDERVCLKDPLRAEELRQESDSPPDIEIEKDVQKWKEQRDSTIQEVEKMFDHDHGKKEKEDLFSKIEEKIRKGGKEERKSPLDALFEKNLRDKS